MMVTLQIGEPPTLQRLRQRLEAEQAELTEIERQVSQNRSKLDSYQQQKEEQELRLAQVRGGAWLNLAGFCLAVGGAAAIAAGTTLGGGVASWAAYALGGSTALAGAACFRERYTRSEKTLQATLKARDAQLGVAACKIYDIELQSRLSKQTRQTDRALQVYELASQPLQLLAPDSGSLIEERNNRILVGSSVLARRLEQRA